MTSEGRLFTYRKEYLVAEPLFSLEAQITRAFKRFTVTV